MSQLACMMNSDALCEIFVSFCYLLYIALLLPFIVALIGCTIGIILFGLYAASTEFQKQPREDQKNFFKSLVVLFLAVQYGFWLFSGKE